MIGKQKIVVFVGMMLALLSIACGSTTLLGDVAEEAMEQAAEALEGTAEAMDSVEEPPSGGGDAPAPIRIEQIVPIQTPTPIPEEVLANLSAQENTLINLYQRVNPSVVAITISGQNFQGDITDVGGGSGFVIDTDGNIVTNNHVVENAEELRVRFSDGAVFPATVRGTDTFADLAVIQIDPGDYPLVPVELGSSTDLLVGQTVVAIGSPFGLENTMTIGIVSAIGRSLPAGLSEDGGVYSNPLIIQTDAAINPGNSGGPLLNSAGEVVGVNTAIRSQSGVNSGIGFAVPVSTVRRIIPQIIETGEVNYPYLGISGLSQLSLADIALEYDLPVTEGVLITDVTSGSGAADAGLRGGDRTVNFNEVPVVLGGDIIVAANGVPIRNFDELIGYLVSNTSVGDTITLTIIREGDVQDVDVVLGARP